MMLQRASMLYHSAKATLPTLNFKVPSRVFAFVRAVSCVQRGTTSPSSTYSPQLAREEEVVPELDYLTPMAHSSPPPAAPVPFTPLFSGMQYDPPPPTPTEYSSIFSGMQYDPSPPTPPEPSGRQYNEQLPTQALHVPQTMQYQAIGPAAGRYRARVQFSPSGMMHQNENFIADMVNSEGPLPTNASLALANTRAATYYTLMTAHAAAIDFGGYWPSELKAEFEFAVWQDVGIRTRSGRCFNERVEISGGRIFHAWVERVPENAGLEGEQGRNAGVGAGGYF